MGNFNATVLERNNVKINYLCDRFQLSQLITYPTRINEHSNSTIGLLLEFSILSII